MSMKILFPIFLLILGTVTGILGFRNVKPPYEFLTTFIGAGLIAFGVDQVCYFFKKERKFDDIPGGLFFIFVWIISILLLIACSEFFTKEIRVLW